MSYISLQVATLTVFIFSMAVAAQDADDSTLRQRLHNAVDQGVTLQKEQGGPYTGVLEAYNKALQQSPLQTLAADASDFQHPANHLHRCLKFYFLGAQAVEFESREEFVQWMPFTMETLGLSETTDDAGYLRGFQLRRFWLARAHEYNVNQLWNQDLGLDTGHILRDFLVWMKEEKSLQLLAAIDTQWIRGLATQLIEYSTEENLKRLASAHGSSGSVRGGRHSVEDLYLISGTKLPDISRSLFWAAYEARPELFSDFWSALAKKAALDLENVAPYTLSEEALRKFVASDLQQLVSRYQVKNVAKEPLELSEGERKLLDDLETILGSQEIPGLDGTAGDPEQALKLSRYVLQRGYSYQDDIDDRVSIMAQIALRLNDLQASGVETLLDLENQ